ncbi:uncharacterized protein LOC112049545 [Bicyclus anynana]|uniref:Uncharacterized protein LOC112049545 n=1 Tax=Bicyclus anynana TaxID=110368 RepID=A0ABM3LYS0_BICAN|nr:uncharacterized protein LOC112049545 [Bicyclus anynana]
MSYPIKFLLLQKSELIYEVIIRGESPADNVSELRRQVTKLTQKYPSEEILESCLDFAEDHAGITETLTKIKCNIDTLKTDLQKPLIDRTANLLNHIYHRLQRVVTSKKSDNTAALADSRDFYETLCVQLQKIVKTEARSRAESTSNPDYEQTSLDNLTKLSITCERSLSPDLAKIKFDGKSCVRSFIERVEEFRVSKDVTDKKMLSYACDLFIGDALHWYRSIKRDVDTWKDLLTTLKEDFDLVDYDYRMLSEIRSRTQGATENIITYFAIMKGMFSRLNKDLPEEEKLEILIHNIRPCYASVLFTCSDIKSIDELRSICRNYERIKIRCDNFKEPPTSNSNSVAPEFAYRHVKESNKIQYTQRYYNTSNFKPNSYNSNTSNLPNKELINKTYAINETLTKSSTKYCHRCRDNTHTMSECQAERTIFCFKCGLKDYRTPDCPKCTPKETETKN